MSGKKYVDGDLNFPVSIDTKIIRRLYKLFAFTFTLSGIVTLFYTERQFPLHIAIGAISVIAGLHAIGMAYYWVHSTRLQMVLISSAILARPMSLIVRIIENNEPSHTSSWVGIFIYTAFWSVFLMLWFYLMEPYAKYRHEMAKTIEDKRKAIKKLAAEQEALRQLQQKLQ